LGQAFPHCSHFGFSTTNKEINRETAGTFVKVIAAVLPALLLLVTTASSARAQVSGAIYTTLADGTAVNHNIYDSRRPFISTAAPKQQLRGLLPNAVYYFQVTDPSGKTLLSTDNAIDRRLYVENNRVWVSAYVPLIDPTT
jgi:hypothetical protein